MKTHIPLHMLLLAGLALFAAGNTKKREDAAPPATPPPAQSPAQSPATAGSAPRNAAAGAPATAGSAPRTAAGALRTVAFLGVDVAPVTAGEARELGLSAGSGLRVRFVAPQSPAHGRLRAGDVLVWLDQQLLCNGEQFRVLVRAKKPGEFVAFKIYRAGDAVEVPVKLGGVVAGGATAGGGAAVAGGAGGGCAGASRALPEVRVRVNGREVSLNEFLRAGAGSLGDWLDNFRDDDGVVRLDADRLAADGREHLRKVASGISGGVAGGKSAGGKPAAVVGGKSVGEKSRPQSSLPAAGTCCPTPEEACPDCAQCCAFVLRDGENSISLNVKNAKKTLIIRGAGGVLLFEGQVDTAEQRERLSEQQKKWLKTIEELAGSAFMDGEHGRSPKRKQK